MSAEMPTPAGLPDRTRLAGIAAAIGAVSAVGTSISLALPLLAVVLEKRGVSNFLIGANTATAGIAAMICTPFVPVLARKMGAAWLLVASILLGVAIFPLFYVFDSLTVWFVLRFVFTISLNATFVLSEFWMNALAPDGKRGLIMGIYGTVLSLGFAVGPLILSLVGSDGFLPFGIGIAIMGLSLLPALLAFRAPPSMEGGKGGNFLHFLTVVPLATFAAFAMGSVESSVMNFAAVYGLRLGYEESLAALLVVAVAVGNIVSQLPIGLLADRVNKRLLLLLIPLIGTGLAVLTPLFSANFPMLAVMIGATGAVAACLYTVGLTHLGERMKGADLASANAAFIFMYALGMLVGPSLTGLGMDMLGPNGFFVVVALLLGSYGVLAALRIAGNGLSGAGR